MGKYLQAGSMEAESRKTLPVLKVWVPRPRPFSPMGIFKPFYCSNEIEIQ